MTGHVDTDQTAMGCQLLKFVKMTEEMVDSRHNQGKVRQSSDP
jgi:hypothetical protein